MAEEQSDKVWVEAPLGGVGTIPRAQLEEAVRQGYKPAGQEQVARAQKEVEFGDVGSTAAAAATGYLSSATLGLSDAAIAERYGEKGRQHLQGLREVQGGARLAGELGGAVLAPGAVAAGRAGAAAMRGRGALTRFGVMSAQGAAEGAAFGGGQALGDAVIENKQLTSERLFTAMQQGALMGGGFGAALGGGSWALGKAIGASGKHMQRALANPGKEGAEAVAQGMFGKPAKGLAKRMADYWAAASDLAGVKGAQSAKQLMRMDAQGRYARRVLGDADAIVARHGDGLTEDLTRAHESIGLGGALFKGELKANQVGRLIKSGNEAATSESTNWLLTELRSRFGHMRDMGKGEYAKQSNVKQLLRRVDVVEKKIAKSAFRPGSRGGRFNRDAFMQLDSLKREIGAEARALGRKRSLSSTEHATYNALEESYENVRRVLEDSDLWGGAAKIQRSVNEPWSNLIGAQKQTRFLKHFTEQTEKRGPGVRFGQKSDVVTRKKVGAFLDGITNPDESEALGGLHEYLARGEEFVDAMRTHARLTASERKALDQYAKSVQSAKGRLGEVTEAATLRNQFRTLTEGGSESALLGGLFGAGIGSGSPLAALGAVLGPVMSPARGIKQLAAIESLAGRVAERVSANSDSLFAAAAVPARLGPRIEPAVTRAAKYSSDPRDEYERRSASVRQFQESAPALADQLRQTLGETVYGAPEVADGVVATAMRANSYLLRHMPEMDRPFGPDMRIPRIDAIKWLRRVRAIGEPESLLEDAAKGELTPEAVDAIRETQPATYADIRQDIWHRLVDLKAEGKQLPYRHRVQLGLLLDLPTDTTIEPSFLQLVQAGYAQAHEQERAGPSRRAGAAPDMAKHMKTDQHLSMNDEE